MENITVGQIGEAIGIITLIGGFILTICKVYKKMIGDRFTKIEKRLTFVEKKREEYEQEIQYSNLERSILLEGELAALKGLNAMIPDNDAVSKSIARIEKYMLKRSHGLNGYMEEGIE